jgi:hypothetical protein
VAVIKDVKSAFPIHITPKLIGGNGKRLLQGKSQQLKNSEDRVEGITANKGI